MDLVVRTVAIFVFLLLVMRLVGKRPLSNLEPFDLIMLVVIGDLVQQGVTQTDQSVTGSFIVISTIAIMSVMTGWLSFRSQRLRRVLEGRPVVLMQDSRPNRQNMRRERITIEDLEEEARRQQINSLDDVDWAILENDGKISIIPRR